MEPQVYEMLEAMAGIGLLFLFVYALKNRKKKKLPAKERHFAGFGSLDEEDIAH